MLGAWLGWRVPNAQFDQQSFTERRKGKTSVGPHARVANQRRNRRRRLLPSPRFPAQKCDLRPMSRTLQRS